MVEINERLRRPEALPQLFARDDITASLEEQDEDVNGSAAQPDPSTLLEELTGAAMNLVDAEAKHIVPQVDSRHRP